jgi:hypothetical protein
MRRFFADLLGFKSARAQGADAQARELAAWRATALANFPFEIVETSGRDALAKWEELKTAGRGVPVVIGKHIDGVLAPFHPESTVERKPISETLAAANAIRFPEDFFRMRREEDEAAVASLKEMGLSVGDIETDEELEALEGEWPTIAGVSPGLAVAYDRTPDEYWPTVYIVLVRTEDPTTVPAHLHWGNWNACPAPQYHVAALRSWRDRYGAELVGLNGDTLNLRVARKPSTRDEALDLARLQYAYCNDIVDQGTESLKALAAELMAHDWWFFWWD